MNTSQWHVIFVDSRETKEHSTCRQDKLVTGSTPPGFFVKFSIFSYLHKNWQFTMNQFMRSWLNTSNLIESTHSPSFYPIYSYIFKFDVFSVKRDMYNKRREDETQQQRHFEWTKLKADFVNFWKVLFWCEIWSDLVIAVSEPWL